MKKTLVYSIFLALSINAHATEKMELQHFWMSPGEQLALKQIEMHASKAGIDIESFANDDYNTLRKNVSERLSLGYLPEATHWIGGENLSILAESESLIPLPTTINGQPLKSILHNEVYESLIINGEVIALPVGIHLQTSAVYNMETLSKIGKDEVPMDWKSFLENAEELEAIGILPLALTDEFWVLREMFHGILLSFGQKQTMIDLYDVFDESGTLKDHLLKTFEIFLELRKYADAEHKGRSWSDTVKLVIDGKASAVFIGDFARSEIAYFGKDNLDNYTCSGLPGLQNAYFQTDIFVLFNNKNPEWKGFYQDFVGSILSPESTRDYLFYKGGLPAIKGVEPTDLNQCSQASLRRWNENPEQRFISTQRDSKLVAAMHEILPKLWDTPDLTAVEATEIVYSGLQKRSIDQ